jgi:hypothetical protein
MTSGAKYSGVPQTEKASLVPLTFFFERPKSVILIYPSMSMRTFSGLRLGKLRDEGRNILSVDDVVLVKII